MTHPLMSEIGKLKKTRHLGGDGFDDVDNMKVGDSIAQKQDDFLLVFLPRKPTAHPKKG